MIYGLPTVPNKQLYNGGSEWQNDYSNLPNYQQTFYRNYDAALGRWIGVDPKVESAESMTSYQYAGNNPIIFNDPLGDLLPMPGSHTPPPVDYSVCQLLPATGPLGGQSMDDWFNMVGSSDYQSFRADLEGGNGSVAKTAAIQARDAAGSSAGATSYTYAASISSAFRDAVSQGYSPYIEAGVRYSGTWVMWNKGDDFSQGGVQTASVFVSANQGENVNNNIVETVYKVNEILDAENTITSVIKTAGQKFTEFSGTKTLAVLGKITGAVTVIHNFNKSWDEWHDNKLLSIFHFAEGVTQGAVLLLGGEEVELAYNVTTLVLDQLVDHNKK